MAYITVTLYFGTILSALIYWEWARRKKEQLADERLRILAEAEKKRLDMIESSRRADSEGNGSGPVLPGHRPPPPSRI